MTPPHRPRSGTASEAGECGGDHKLTHIHRAASLSALVCAVHSRDPEVWRHGCGLQPAEAQARDPVCVGRVSPALHGMDPGGGCAQGAEWAGGPGHGCAQDGPSQPLPCTTRSEA